MGRQKSIGKKEFKEFVPLPVCQTRRLWRSPVPIFPKFGVRSSSPLERAGVRFLLSLCTVLATVIAGFAQSNIPTTATGPGSATPKALPSYNETPARDYLRVLVPVMPTKDSSRITINAAADSVNISTSYFDDMGRPLQTVIKQASPLKKDEVVPDAYDEFGRTVTSYLPFVQQTSNTNDGKFKTSQFTGDSSFYKSNFPNESINYGQTVFEPSPLQRVTKQLAPGNSWAGAGVGISATWKANTASDSVRLWTIAISSENDVPATTATYSAGSLAVQQVTDERGVKTVTYVDELGRTILTKQQVSASPATGHYGWVCTYYVYDEMNHLRVVVTPKAVDALNTGSVNWNLSGNPTIKTGLCYSYYYDARGRAIMKYIPGKGKSYIAYDLYDRVVMTQDSNLRRTNQWAFVLYDGESRPWESGVITTSLTKDSVIAQAARSTAYPTLTGTFTIMNTTYYDDYSWISGSIPNSTLVTTYINSSNFNTSYNTYPDYAQQITQSSRIRGMVTGTKRIILNTANYLYSVPLYDDHGRVIQLKQTNYTGGTDIATTQYRFNGVVLRTHLYQQKSGTNAQTHTLLTKYSYDQVGRVKTIIKNIDGTGDKTIATDTYNELGQLKSKVLGSSIDSLVYTYNIRGWLLGINKSFVDTYNSAANYFGEDLFYDYGFTNNQVNGAIAGVKWKGRGDTIARAYGFSYDNANRLTKADFSQNIRNTNTWTNSTADFTTSNLTYDDAGNILTMKQRGLMIGSSATIDSLTYTYYSNNNQLQKVADAAAATTGLGDFQDSSLTTDYAYDANGNIVKDYNRHMHTPANGNGAVYNLLDKPDSLVISNRATLYYTYDASGATLVKRINDYSTSPTTVKNYVYIAGFVYLNDTLQYVNTEEGRIRWADDNGRWSFVYDYYLRDHLGNVRTVLTEEKDTALYPIASLETAQLSNEKLYYFGEDSGRINKSGVSGYPTDNTTSPNDYIQQLSGSGYKIGTGIVLKVMAGDQILIKATSWYNKNGVTPGTPSSPLNALINALISGVGGVTNAAHGITPTQLQNSGVLIPGATAFYGSHNSADSTTKPKAFLNWILLDDQFKYVASSSGFDQVGSDQQFKTHYVTPTMAKNGFLYVYVSNETPNINVYFDNLTVTHIKSPLLQEQSYYPFGLQMAGISDKALGKLDSKNKFDGGVNFEEDYGVNLYQTFYRGYDPQIGRFGGVDILSEKTFGMSVYGYCGSDPIMFSDPFGSDRASALPTLQEIIAGLWGSEYGGFWSANSPNSDFVFGDQATEDFFSTGGGGGDFMNNVASAYDFVQRQQSSGNNVVYFDISQAKNGDYYATGGYYGGLNLEVNASGSMIKDLGRLQPGMNALNYSWEQPDEQQSDQESDQLTWWDYTKVSLDLAGAIIQTGVGIITSETGIGGVVAVDGAFRIAGNLAKLTNMIETSSKSESEETPTNAGQMVGATIDYFSNNDQHQAQAIGGTVDDVITLFASPETSYKSLNRADDWLNGPASPNAWRGIGEDIHSIHNSFH